MVTRREKDEGDDRKGGEGGLQKDEGKNQKVTRISLNKGNESTQLGIEE